MSSKKGFTIVELLIATTVFSVILLVTTAGLIYIGKVYYRTVAQNKTQEATRSIIDQVSQTIQFTGGSVEVPGNGAVCIGDVMYVKTENSLVTGSSSGLVRSNYTGACNPASPKANSSELVPEGMFLREFNVIESPNSGLYRIVVQIVSVPNDETVNPDGTTVELFNGTNCSGGAGSEYCATARLTTTVKKRL